MKEATLDLEYSFFQRKILDLMGIDLSSYKSEQMRRRLNTIMARAGAKNLFDYYRLLAQDPVKQKEFRDFVTINVSEFFRIPEKFDYLKHHLLPELLARRSKLSIWSAGCSNGAEPYSLAMLLSEAAPFRQARILATDIDATVLERARVGIYSKADIQSVPNALLGKYFVQTGDLFQVVPTIRNKVEFKVHDLLRDDYEMGFDLIVCRHVLIYFTEEAKDEVFRKFNRSLRTGGFLFVGGTEMIRRPKEMGFESIAVSFYRKRE